MRDSVRLKGLAADRWGAGEYMASAQFEIAAQAARTREQHFAGHIAVHCICVVVIILLAILVTQ